VRDAGIAQGLEGIVRKPLTSRYYPGKRRDWIKIKNVRPQEVIIGGWTPGEGRRRNLIGSLLLGIYDHTSGHHRLTYVGNVGTGFTGAMLGDLAARLAVLARESSPFDTAVPRDVVRDAHRSTPTSSVRSPSANGPQTATYATRPGVDSDPTNNPKTYTKSYRVKREMARRRVGFA
jgi:bifunctional non-homologous end joining protein LigD